MRLAVNARLRATFGLPALLTTAGCNNPMARNLEDLFVWYGLERNIAHWMPAVVGTLVVYFLFRFMLGDTRR